MRPHERESTWVRIFGCGSSNVNANQPGCGSSLVIRAGRTPTHTAADAEALDAEVCAPLTQVDGRDDPCAVAVVARQPDRTPSQGKVRTCDPGLPCGPDQVAVRAQGINLGEARCTPPRHRERALFPCRIWLLHPCGPCAQPALPLGSWFHRLRPHGPCSCDAAVTLGNWPLWMRR